MFEAIVLSWLIAFGEYCFQGPANRIGYGEFTGYQLKTNQESVTITVFVFFAYFCLGERMRWNYAVSFLLIFGAVVLRFGESCSVPFKVLSSVTKANKLFC